MNRRRVARVTGVAAGLVVIAAAVVVVVLVITFIRKPLPDRGGEVTLSGLGATVTVIRDDKGVPQIYADDADDLFRAQGYVQAQDQFFQMDLRRHITSGTLSELVGDNQDALLSDATVRTLGWRRVAEQELTQLDSKTQEYLDAYAQGVNDYIANRSPSELSVSYTILSRDHKLEPIKQWTAVDSLSWLKAIAWDLRSNYDEELERARAADRIKDLDRINQLFPPYPSTHAPIIAGDTQASTAGSADVVPHAFASADNTRTSLGSDDSGSDDPAKRPADPSGLESAITSTSAQTAFSNADDAIGSLPNLLGTGEGIGSNAWVVSGSLTASGLPLLANDPHLAVSQPGPWYQNGLHCNQVTAGCPFDVAGYSFAGLPGVVIGHNGDVSWGLTNLEADTTDFYLEKVTGNDVQVDGKQVPMAVRSETINVAGGKAVTINVRTTKHGPLLSDVLDAVKQAGTSAPVAGRTAGQDSQYAVSLDWTAQTPGHAMDAFFGIDQAKDFTSFQTAAQELDAPALGLIYADTSGHIGYQAAGRSPIRGKGEPRSPVPSDGTWPHPGWDSAYDWTGFVPGDQMPSQEDPASGYIVAANQEVSASSSVPATSSGSGHVYLTQDWDYGFRSQRISDLLTKAMAGGHKLTVGDMRNIQSDTYNPIAEVLVPLLLKTTGNDAFTQQAVNLLKTWDYTQPASSAAAAYFNVVYADILNIAFGDELPEGFRPDGGDRWFEVVLTLLDRPTDVWWDDKKTPDVVESRDEVLRRSLAQARLQLTTSLGKDPKHWQWGRLHQVRLEQTPLGDDGGNRLVRDLVDTGPFEAPGGSSIVDAFSWDASSGSFDVTSAPSMRMIVDLSDLDSSRWVNETGISGHPWDSHYDDQTQAWLKGDDYPWPFSVSAVKAAAGDTLTLNPGSS